jgi:Zn-dependent protease with chaperone function
MPPDLTTPTTSYRVRVLVVLGSLLLFASLYLGLVVGSAYLCYWSFATLGSPAPGNVTGLYYLLQEASRTEQRVLSAYNDALQQRRDGKIDDGKFLQILDRDVVPPWRALRQRLAQAQGLPRHEQRIVEQIGHSFQLQEESWELLGQALRHNDRQAAEQAKHKAWESQLLARQSATDARDYFSNRAPRQSQGSSDGWKIIVGIVAGLLCLFLVKGFFKWRRADAEQRLEVTEKDQPVLFAFIRQLCRDTRAPLPHRIYLTAEVNAAVFYHESLLSLVLPTPKNLVIGLGLINQLNLSEFKAVLAHEFGHFSQNSMKLGSYVYTSNRVIAELVFGRDWLDQLVGALRGTDIRIAIFAWAFTGIMWVLRMTLQGLFRVINFANSSLSRQMEFNADLVAVSVTGSDALVNGLARLDFASESLGQAWQDLTAAADHELYSRDLFYHQSRANEYLRARRNNPRLGEPPVLPEDPTAVVQVFPPDDVSVPRMWATHPSNHDREVNAKRRYIRSPIDERSPWILFNDGAAVRAEITRRIYQSSRRLQEVKMEAPEVVQAFIDAEHAETTYHSRYHGLYNSRYLTPGDLDELMRSAAEPVGTDRLAEEYALLYGGETRQRMEEHRSRQEDYRRVASLAHGAVELTGTDFEFRGNRYQPAAAKQLLDQVGKEIDQDFEWMGRVDRQAFLIHYRMARQVGAAILQELQERYRFHMAVQNLHNNVSAHNQQVHATLDQLAGQPEMSEGEFYGIIAVFQAARDALRQALETADQLQLPSLRNMTPGAPLGRFLLNQPLEVMVFDRGNSLDGQAVGRLLERTGEILDKLQRIHFKSLGGILALQERLAEQWASERSAVQIAPIAIGGQ